FDDVDGHSIHNLYIGGPTDETVNYAIQANQTTAFATYGISNRVDLSVAIPFSTVSASVAFDLLLPVQPGSTPTRFYPAGRHTASGIGDVNLYLKGSLLR